MNNFINWKDFWKNYRNIDPIKDDDLFFQVGKTINGKSISKYIFNKMIIDIKKELKLNKNDVLYELCCGNGLLSYPLSKYVCKVNAFDFTEHLISTAINKNHRSNITYKVGDAKSNFFQLFSSDSKPKKFLMNDSLAYFSSEDLYQIINTILSNTKNFRFYLTGVPNEDLKWLFYNTPSRVEDYILSSKNGDVFAKGIGKWWNIEDIRLIAKSLNLKFLSKNQISCVSNYRTDILLISE